MKQAINLIFHHKPSAIYTLWQAFRSRKSRFASEEKVPVIHASRSSLRINARHLKAFYEICHVGPLPFLHILYPLTLCYPYMMRILCRREMPFSLFKVLNTRTSIIMRRGIRPDETLDINCYNSPVRIISKGLEVDIISEIRAGEEKVWKNITTYFVRGGFGGREAAYTPPRLEPIDSAPVIKEWYLPAKDRFRFARVSGDTNGLHYGSLYARMQGFKRDFAQPIRIVAQCVSSLPDVGMERPLQLDFFLKGPVYYENTLVLKHIKKKNSDRFDLYCKRNTKPCISGELRSA
ncbi:MAG: hypothetical protein A2Z08_11075 [Deltaproteobacteria bacterium RBG_16_54_11]|nr:MAG: hypothetical protein A2Z08_11075 [Deltaproteobacteria bacterium RBG_16_54_11]